ncbi:MAG: hypothetical protein LBF57_00885 [Holosporaceae bacterium]|jgi:hypothetical protein|nr:hypothetical protein [Holosporaceae bacterium]
MKKVLVIFLAVSTLACRGDGKNSVTVSSGYFEGQYTNGQIANFGMELVGGLSRLDNYIFGDITDPGLGGWCGYFLFYVASQIVSCRIFGVPFHELGHSLRAKAFGRRYALHFDSDYKTRDFKKDENFFKFFSEKRIEAVKRRIYIY